MGSDKFQNLDYIHFYFLERNLEHIPNTNLIINYINISVAKCTNNYAH